MHPRTTTTATACRSAAGAPTPRRARPASGLRRPARPPPPTAGLSYKDAGVDIDAGNELVRRIKKLNPSIGGFSGMVPFGERNLGGGRGDVHPSMPRWMEHQLTHALGGAEGGGLVDAGHVRVQNRSLS